MAARSKSQVCSRFITGIAGSNPAEVMDVVCCVRFFLCCVGSRLCDELFVRSEVSYRVCVCVCVCVSDCV